MLNPQMISAAGARLAAAAHAPLKVIVFGSYARGEASDASDLDLLVVEEDIPDFTEEYLRLRKAVDDLDLGVGVDLLIYPKAEFERRRDWCSTPVYWAIREGKVLYDASARQR
jgi:predicted nucleotidyltransferase